jgi:hypothetical protein|tara:strand:- start:250 stop:561 length:312 start_codon:yes stop_codon:yes gene_type:complete
MSRLLQTRLPVAAGGSVDSATFNRLVRILEINLGAVDFTISPHFNSDEVASLQFATGAIIFNTTLEIHQAFDGVALRDLYGHQTYVLNSSGITSAVGALTVSI